jgi:PhnB protein
MSDQERKTSRSDVETMTIHFIVRGARRAAEWYKDVFGAKELGNVPVPGDKYMQIELSFGNTTAMLADEFPEMGVLGPHAGATAVVFHLVTPDARGLTQRAVRSGAEIIQPLQEQFWGELYGQIRDPFGHRWGISQWLRDVDPQEISRTAWKLFGGS